MELLLQQLMAGLATGAIYAAMALAVVMIYQAIDHLNFAQGEMAMFSTLLAWQMIQWGQPYWVAFIGAVVLSFLVGIRVGWMLALGWGMSAAVGAVAGMLIAPVVFLEPNMMLGVLLYGFAGAVLGGLSSPGGAVAGGFAVGVIENLAGSFIPYVGRELKLTIALVLIVAVLMVRPSGVFGRTVVSRV